MGWLSWPSRRNQAKRVSADVDRALRAQRSYEHTVQHVNRYLQSISVEELIRNPEGGLNHVMTAQTSVGQQWGWQYAAAAAIARAVMLQGWVIRDRSTLVEVEAHPGEALLRNVNPVLTGEEFRYTLTLEIMFTGSSFWQVARNGLGEPAELWSVCGDVRPVASQDTRGELLYWEVRDSKGRTQRIDPEDMLFLRLPQMGSLYGAVGPVQTAGGAVQIDRERLAAMFSNYKRGIHPNVTLSISDDYTPSMRKQFMDEFKAKYAGSSKSGEPIGLPSGVKMEFPPRPNDLALANSGRMMRDEILSQFGVPAAILGLSDDVNRASAEAMEYVFSKWTILPLVRMLDARLNQDLFQRTPAWEGVEIFTPDVVPADKAQLQSEREGLLDRYVISPNEARAEVGYDEAPWGKAPLAPLGVGPLGQATGDGGTEEQSVPRRIVVLQDNSRRRRDEAYATYLTGSDRFRRSYERSLRAVFDDYGKAVLEAAEASYRQQAAGLTPAVEDALDPDKLAKRIERVMANSAREGIYLGGLTQAEIAGIDVDGSWSPVSGVADAYREEYGAKFAGGIADTYHGRLTESIQEAIANRESWPEMQSRLLSTFETQKASHVANIITTETTRLWGAGGQAFREQFALESKEWVAAFVNTRDSHAAMDGTQIPNTELFDVNGDRMMSPGMGSIARENCNCNCIAIAVV